MSEPAWSPAVNVTVAPVGEERVPSVLVSDHANVVPGVQVPEQAGVAVKLWVPPVETGAETGATVTPVSSEAVTMVMVAGTLATVIAFKVALR